MALGAKSREVLRSVVSELFTTVGVGLVIGMRAAIAGALAGRAVLDGVLFELSPTDSVNFF